MDEFLEAHRAAGTGLNSEGDMVFAQAHEGGPSLWDRMNPFSEHNLQQKHAELQQYCQPNCTGGVSPEMANLYSQATAGTLGAVSPGPLIGAAANATRALSVDTAVQFGRGQNQISHAFRHVDSVGLNRGAVRHAIRQNIGSPGSLNPGLNTGSTVVNGIRIDYTAYKLPSGVVNVGRITPAR